MRMVAIVSWWGGGRYLRLWILLDERLKGVKFRRFPFHCFSGAMSGICVAV
jgi:hypothetical protein